MNNEPLDFEELNKRIQQRQDRTILHNIIEAATILEARITALEDKIDVVLEAFSLRESDSYTIRREVDAIKDDIVELAKLEQHNEEDPVVLGLCPHGINLDQDFCILGCRR